MNNNINTSCINKKIYKTKATADDAAIYLEKKTSRKELISRAKGKRASGVKQLRSYYCAFCSGFHLSSMNKKDVIDGPTQLVQTIEAQWCGKKKKHGLNSILDVIDKHKAVFGETIDYYECKDCSKYHLSV